MRYLGPAPSVLRAAPALLACALAISCGSSVTLETSGAGGTAGSTATGGTTTGGASTGGTTTGGASTGGTGAGGATGGGGTGGAPTCPGLGDACTDCLSAGCPEVYCACSAEIHCGGYLQCLGTCEMAMDIPACAQNCAKVHEPGISAAILTADCAATTCDADCQFGKALLPCQKCLYTSCAPEMNACIADPECLALIQCIQACAPGDMACSSACVQAHPDGFAEAQAAGTCRKDQCADACP